MPGVIVRPLGPLTYLAKVGHQRRYTHIDHLRDSRFTGGKQSAPVVIHSPEIVQGSVILTTRSAVDESSDVEPSPVCVGALRHTRTC